MFDDVKKIEFMMIEHDSKLDDLTTKYKEDWAKLDEEVKVALEDAYTKFKQLSEKIDVLEMEKIVFPTIIEKYRNEVDNFREYIDSYRYDEVCDRVCFLASLADYFEFLLNNIDVYR